MIFSVLKINDLRWHDFFQAYKSMTYHVMKMFHVVTSEIYFVVVHTGRCLTRLRFGGFVHAICLPYMVEIPRKQPHNGNTKLLILGDFG